MENSEIGGGGREDDGDNKPMQPDQPGRPGQGNPRQGMPGQGNPGQETPGTGKPGQQNPAAKYLFELQGPLAPLFSNQN